MGSEKELSEVFKDLLFPRIFQTFRMSIQPGKLIIAFSAVAVICLAGWIMDFSKTVVAAPNVQGKITETELEIYMTDPANVKSYIEIYRERGSRSGVFSTLWHFSAARFHGAVNSLFAFDIPAVVANIADYFRAAGWAVRYHLLYSIVFFVIKLGVISVAGGALCRMTALQFARGEKPGLTGALRFSTKKFTSFFTAPLVPVCIIIFTALFVFLLGLIGNIPRVGELIVGMCMLLALIAGLLITILLIGTVAGFNLMFPAVAYDGSDGFDAISRSFSYVYSKPWRMGFYTAIAAIYGAICYTFVRFFGFLTLWVTHWFLQFGVWVENSKEINKLTSLWPEPTFTNLLGSSAPAPANWTESLAAFLIYLVVLVVIGMVASFIISFYFSANTIIYALLRNRVDNTALDDIYAPQLEDSAVQKDEKEVAADDVKTERNAVEPEETD